MPSSTRLDRRARSGSASVKGVLQQPAPLTRQAATTVIGTTDANERWGSRLSNPNSKFNSNPNSSPRTKSKVFGWFLFRSSKSESGGNPGASSSSMGMNMNNNNANNTGGAVVVQPPPPPSQLLNGDIAERVNDYLSAPHIPRVHRRLRLHLRLIVLKMLDGSSLYRLL